VGGVEVSGPEGGKQGEGEDKLRQAPQKNTNNNKGGV